MHQDSKNIVAAHLEVDNAVRQLAEFTVQAKALAKEIKKLRDKKATAIQHVNKAMVTPRMSHLHYLLDVTVGQQLKKARVARALLQKHGLQLGTVDKKAGCYRVKLDPSGFTTATQALRALDRVLPFIDATKGSCQVIEVTARRKYRRELHIAESGEITVWRYAPRGAPCKLEEKESMLDYLVGIYGDKPTRKVATRPAIERAANQAASA
jgi:hypothetical protein